MFQMVVVLENRHEYVPFFSQWAACVKAADYAKCVDVEKVYVTDAETGEIMAEFKQNSVFLFARPGHVCAAGKFCQQVVSTNFRANLCIK